MRRRAKNFLPLAILLLVKSTSGGSVKRNIPPSTLSNFYHPPTASDPYSFEYGYETEEGIKQSAIGERKTVDDNDVVVMSGSYEYVGDDGRVYSVTWTADENGFQPVATHIPTTPTEIQQSQQQRPEQSARQARFEVSRPVSVAPPPPPPPPIQPSFFLRPSPPLVSPPTFATSPPPSSPLRRPHFIVKRRRRQKRGRSRRRGPKQLSNQFFRTLAHLI